MAISTIKKLAIATASAALIVGTTVKAANAASVVNGGFETGDFAGWTVVNQDFGSGNWFNTTGGRRGPLGNSSIPSAIEGKYYAVTDQSSPDSLVLFQDIFLEADSQHQLSFNWFAQSSARLANPGNLNKDSIPNQQFRVDLVSPGFSDWFGSSSSAGVLANILAPVASPAQWTSTTFDLSAWAGQTVRLAFREVANQGIFQAGVDNVRISSTPTKTVPEPASTLGLLALGAMGAGSMLKRKNKGVFTA